MDRMRSGSGELAATNAVNKAIREIGIDSISPYVLNCSRMILFL